MALGIPVALHYLEKIDKLQGSAARHEQAFQRGQTAVAVISSQLFYALWQPWTTVIVEGSDHEAC
jgi:hypothetical protein